MNVMSKMKTLCAVKLAHRHDCVNWNVNRSEQTISTDCFVSARFGAWCRCKSEVLFTASDGGQS